MASALTDTLGGLLPPLSALESAARSRGLATQDKVSKAWPSNGNVDTMSARALKPLCRKGIPAALRPDAWFWLSGGASKQAAAPAGYYRQLCSSTSEVGEDVMFAIEQDVRVGFNNHKLVSSAKGSEALNRMLLALAQHLSSTSGSYSHAKGLAQAAALLLIVFGLEREQEAFFTLAALVQDKMFPFASSEVPLATRVEQGVLAALVQRKLPNVHAHLARLNIPLDRLTAGWFVSGFAGALPAETTLRVWDALVLEGAKVPLRVALALIKRYEAVIISGSQVDLMRKVLCLRTSRTFDAEELMQSAFGSVGSMPSATLAKVRRGVYDRLVAEQQRQSVNGSSRGGGSGTTTASGGGLSNSSSSNSLDSASTGAGRGMLRSRTSLSGATATSAATAAAAGPPAAPAPAPLRASRSMEVSVAATHKRRWGAGAV